MEHDYHQTVTDEQRRDFLKALGLSGVVAAGGMAADDVTLADLRNMVTTESTGELANRGQTIRDGLSGTLDAELLGAEMAGIADAIEQLPDVYATGIPSSNEDLYSELTNAGWRIDSHLFDVGFYASAEANLPRFSADHIETWSDNL